MLQKRTKTVWGLSNYALTAHDVDAGELRSIVTEWLRFTNPRGTGRGSGCYEGAFEAPFDRGGCGGMQEKRLPL